MRLRFKINAIYQLDQLMPILKQDDSIYMYKNLRREIWYVYPAMHKRQVMLLVKWYQVSKKL